MVRIARALALSLATLPLAACATLGPSEQPVSVTGQITYRERMALPPTAQIEIQLSDVSLMDAPSRTMAEVRQPLNGRAPPYAVTLSVPSDKIDARHRYAARAEIRDASGALRFTTDTNYAVLTNGASNSADIVMVGVR